MSCNCGCSYNKLPCCCPTVVENPCTTTTTICPDAQPCYLTLESNCILYNGANYTCAGITTGMTVAEVVEIIINALGLSCTTSTTTTTTTSTTSTTTSSTTTSSTTTSSTTTSSTTTTTTAVPTTTTSSTTTSTTTSTTVGPTTTTTSSSTTTTTAEPTTTSTTTSTTTTSTSTSTTSTSTTTTSTTLPAICIDCFQYTLTGDGNGGFYEYTDCLGNFVPEQEMPFNTDPVIVSCAISVSVTSGVIDVVQNALCGNTCD